MKNIFKRVVSSAIAVMLAVPIFSYANVEKVQYWGTGFDGYSASPGSPRVPGGTAGSLNDGGILYSYTVDEEHGTSLAVEDPEDKGVWIGSSFAANIGGKIQFSFDIRFERVAGCRFNLFTTDGNPIIMSVSSGNFSLMNLTESNAASAEIYNKYKAVETNTWYHFDFFIDANTSKYDVYTGKDGAEAELLGEGIAIPMGNEIKSVRFTAAGKDIKAYLDDFYVYRTVDKPEITDVAYNAEDGTVSVEFNKVMQTDTIDRGLSLAMGREQVRLPISGSLDGNVYTITPQKPLRDGMTYAVITDGSVTCTDGLKAESGFYEFTIPSKSVSASSVFSMQNGAGAEVSISNSGTSAATATVLMCAYRGDCLISSEEKAVTLNPDDEGVTVTVHCDVQGADGAAVYVLDKDLKPLCEPCIQANSNITAGIRSETVPDTFANYSYSITENTVRVYGKAETGEMISVLAGITDGDEPAAAVQTMAKENGYYEVVFSLDESRFASDDYKICVTSESNTENLDFKYSNNTEARNALDKVNKAETWQDIQAAVSDYSKVFALDISDDSDYKKLPEEAVCSLILQEKGIVNYTSGAEFTSLFNRAVCITALNNEADGAEEILKKYAAEFALDPAEFNGLPDTAQAVKIITGKKYSSFSDFLTGYAEAKMLTLISAAKNSKAMEDYLLDTYSKELRLLSDSGISGKYAAIKEKSAVFGRCLSVKYMSVSQLKTAFESAVNSVYENENRTVLPPSSGGFGGGGGGFSGGGGAKVNRVAEASKTEKEEEKPIIKFSDLPESDSQAVYKLVSMGIICGDGDGKFRPNDNVRRDEFVKMLILGLDMFDKNAEAGFEDVPKDNWAYPYVSSAFVKNITNGVSKNSFAPGDNISRQDAVTMLYRTALTSGMITKQESTAKANDTDSAADYAKEAVGFALGGVMTADSKGNFYPQRAATRLETANMIYNFIRLVKGDSI